MDQNFSYGTLSDVYAVINEEEITERERKVLRRFASELECQGFAELNGKMHFLRETCYGQEIISQEDLESEGRDDY